MALPDGQVRETSISAARTALTGLLQGLAEAAEGVPDVTDAELAGLGYDLRHAAPHNVRLKPTGISGQMSLTRGKDDYVHVRTVASSQNRGPWSAIASALAM